MSPRFKHTGKITPDGPLIQVRIGVGDIMRGALAGMGLEEKTVTVRALIDTGASHTVLDPSVVASLNLKAITSFDVRTVASPEQRWDGFEFRVMFGDSFHKNVCGSQLMDIRLGGFGCIVGRDILEHGTLTYLGRQDRYVLELD